MTCWGLHEMADILDGISWNKINVWRFNFTSNVHLLVFGPNWQNGHLTHWDRMTHICVVKLIIIGSDNGLSPGRRQAIIWTNTGILLIGPWGTNFSEISIAIETFSFKKMHWKMSSAKWRPFCLGLNELRAMTLASDASPTMLIYTVRNMLVAFVVLHCIVFFYHTVEKIILNRVRTHYLNQCWPKCLSLHGTACPKWYLTPAVISCQTKSEERLSGHHLHYSNIFYFNEMIFTAIFHRHSPNSFKRRVL